MEEKIDLDSFSKSIENLKEVSVKSKDYIKFIIGLSTGTLVLSTTLAKDFFKTPQYNFILIIGWALLFISIVVGVWILPVLDNVQGRIEAMKRMFANPEEAKWLFMGTLGEHYIIDWMKKLTPTYRNRGISEVFQIIRGSFECCRIETQPVERLEKVD